jgi:hypothetical protein
MIKTVSSFNSQEGKNSNNGNNKNKAPGQKPEKSFATSLSNDLFISRSTSAAIPFGPGETESFSFLNLLKDIKLFFINLINRMWWGPTYVKIKRSKKSSLKPVFKSTTKNPLTLNLSNL